MMQTLKEQKAQVRVLDDSAVTASVRANYKQVPDELSEAPIPFQSSDPLMYSPVSSFLSFVNADSRFKYIMCKNMILLLTLVVCVLNVSF